jgi:hypothetical protein
MYRLLFSIYLSVLLHSFLLFYAIVPDFITVFKPVCGLDFPYIQEQESLLSFDVEFDSKEFADDGKLKEGKKSENPIDFEENLSLDEAGKKKENGKGEEGENKVPVDTSKYETGEWKDLVQKLKETQNMRKSFKNSFEDLISNGGVSGKYMSRYRHYEDMIVKEVFPTVHSIDKTFEEELKESEDVLLKHNERNRIIDEFREGEDPSTIILENEELGETNLPKVPLQMSKAERQKYFDSTLPLPKEKQLEDFVNKFSGFDPDKGDLPLVFRDLYYQNLQRLAYTFSADPTYFTMDYYEENLNKEDYLKNSMKMAADKKGTKTATEILFSIENIYEIQQRALLQYFQHKDLYNTLSPEKKKEIRMETIRRVTEKYKPILEGKKITGYADVQNLYDKRRLEILDHLLKTTPENYRRNDALFEKGRVLWERGLRTNKDTDLTEAKNVWKQIQPGAETEETFLYKKSHELLNKALSKNPGKFSQADQYEITSILNSRLTQPLSEKKEREDRLLWKEKKE